MIDRMLVMCMDESSVTSDLFSLVQVVYVLSVCFVVFFKQKTAYEI